LASVNLAVQQFAELNGGPGNVSIDIAHDFVMATQAATHASLMLRVLAVLWAPRRCP
jgi:hypothetical protein